MPRPTGIEEGVSVMKSNTATRMLSETVDQLALPPLATNWLRNGDILYIGDLVQMTEAALMRNPGFVRRSLNQIKAALNRDGLSLGMKVANWRRPQQSLKERR
jgi:DNA-directed RNA polymerase alpha subunit